MNFSAKQLQKKFKHAKHFGVTGNYSAANAVKFQSAMEAHIADPATKIIQGMYRGQLVIHFVNPQTGLNVIQDASGQFLSGWKLTAEQLKHVLLNGKLGGN
jgi:hypothetical protein